MTDEEFDRIADEMTDAMVFNLRYNLLKEKAESERDPIKKQEYLEKMNQILKEHEDSK